MDPLELMTVGEVAKLFRVDTTSVRRWIASGTLPAVKLPHKNKRTQYRVKKSDIDALLGVGNERT